MADLSFSKASIIQDHCMIPCDMSCTGVWLGPVLPPACRLRRMNVQYPVQTSSEMVVCRALGTAESISSDTTSSCAAGFLLEYVGYGVLLSPHSQVVERFFSPTFFFYFLSNFPLYSFPSPQAAFFSLNSQIVYQDNKEKKMGFGVLDDKYMESPPGTATITDIERSGNSKRKVYHTIQISRC